MLKAIDLFAGIGGNTLGAKMAGIQVIWAANHKPLIVDYHELNHPNVAHKCQDLQQADWSLIPAHDFMLASPCCQGHTVAAGKQGPHHHISRATAWAPLDCLAYHRPGFFMIENVKEMMTRWNLFPHWLNMIEALGYAPSINLLDSADFGIPQHRKRLFIIGTQSKSPIKLKLRTTDHVPFSSIVQPDSAKWSPIHKPGRSKATLERIKNGRKKFGDYFVMPYYTSGSGKTGRSIHRPIGTITTKDRWAIVRDNEMRMLSIPEYRQAMSFPDQTILPKRKEYALEGLGNATCPKLVAKVLKAVLKAA